MPSQDFPSLRTCACSAFPSTTSIFGTKNSIEGGVTKGSEFFSSMTLPQEEQVPLKPFPPFAPHIPQQIYWSYQQESGAGNVCKSMTSPYILSFITNTIPLETESSSQRNNTTQWCSSVSWHMSPVRSHWALFFGKPLFGNYGKTHNKSSCSGYCRVSFCIRCFTICLLHQIILHLLGHLYQSTEWQPGTIKMLSLRWIGRNDSILSKSEPSPKPQKKSPRVHRLPQESALVNRLGFPNDGLDIIAKRIESYCNRRNNRHSDLRPMLGINIGKNKRPPMTFLDYGTCFECLKDLRIIPSTSVPNTPNLRTLQSEEEPRRYWCPFWSEHRGSAQVPFWSRLLQILEMVQMHMIQKTCWLKIDGEHQYK